MNLAALLSDQTSYFCRSRDTSLMGVEASTVEFCSDMELHHPTFCHTQQIHFCISHDKGWIVCSYKFYMSEILRKTKVSFKAWHSEDTLYVRTFAVICTTPCSLTSHMIGNQFSTPYITMSLPVFQSRSIAVVLKVPCNHLKSVISLKNWSAVQHTGSFNLVPPTTWICTGALYWNPLAIGMQT